MVLDGDNGVHIGEGKVIPNPQRLRTYYYPWGDLYPGRIIEVEFERGHAKLVGVRG